MPTYKQLVQDHLGIPTEFLKKYKNTIRKRLIDAAKELEKVTQRDSMVRSPPTEGYPLSLCRYLASSVALMGAPDEQHVIDSERAVEDAFGKTVPASTIITFTTLYYLITALETGGLRSPEDQPSPEDQLSPEDKESLKKLHQRLDDVNWQMSPELVKEVGIEPASKDP